MDNIRTHIARHLLSIGAVFLRPDEPFVWASGIKSPIYCDNRLILTAPEARNEVEQAIADTVKREYPEAEVLMGTATAGIAHAAVAAHLLGLPMGYVRSGNKDHGRQNRIEGRLDKGEKVVVVEDLISTGGSAVYSDGAMQYLKSTGIVVYLHHQLDVLAQRVGNLVTRGVVCHSGCNTLEDLYEERCPLYEKYADLMVDFTGCTVEQCHEKLLKTVKAYLSEHPDC